RTRRIWLPVKPFSPGSFRGFLKSLSRFRDFCGAPCGGRVGTSVVARSCFQAARSSFCQRQKADAHGSGHFFALTYANVTAFSSPCSPGCTTIRDFHG